MNNVWIQLVLVMIGSVAILGGASWLIAPIRRRIYDYADSDTQLEMDRLRERIKQLEAALQHETVERNKLLQQFVVAHEEITALKKSITDLQKINATLQAQIGNREQDRIVVLGIWSGDDLDIVSERDAVYDAGFEYRSLTGSDATRANILRELRTGKYAILEIGSHGDADAAFIGKQELTAGWWHRALKDRGIRVAVVLACFSDSSVADAMKRAGVKHVIGVSGEIEDTAAIEFAEQFYQLFAAGMPVEQAFDEAKLALDYRQSEKLILR